MGKGMGQARKSSRATFLRKMVRRRHAPEARADGREGAVAGVRQEAGFEGQERAPGAFAEAPVGSQRVSKLDRRPGFHAVCARDGRRRGEGRGIEGQVFRPWSRLFSVLGVRLSGGRTCTRSSPGIRGPVRACRGLGSWRRRAGRGRAGARGRAGRSGSSAAGRRRMLWARGRAAMEWRPPPPRPLASRRGPRARRSGSRSSAATGGRAARSRRRAWSAARPASASPSQTAADGNAAKARLEGGFSTVRVGTRARRRSRSGDGVVWSSNVAGADPTRALEDASAHPAT